MCDFLALLFCMKQNFQQRRDDEKMIYEKIKENENL